MNAVAVPVAVQHGPAPPDAEHLVKVAALFGLQQLGEELGAPGTAQSIGNTADRARYSRPGLTLRVHWLRGHGDHPTSGIRQADVEMLALTRAALARIRLPTIQTGDLDAALVRALFCNWRPA